MVLELYYDSIAGRPYRNKLWHFILYSFDVFRIKIEQVLKENVYIQKLGHFALMSMLQFWKNNDPDFEIETRTDEQVRKQDGKAPMPNARNLCNTWRCIGEDMVKGDVFDFIAVSSGHDLAGNQTFYLIHTAFRPYGKFITVDEITGSKITCLDEITTIWIDKSKPRDNKHPETDYVLINPFERSRIKDGRKYDCLFEKVIPRKFLRFYNKGRLGLRKLAPMYISQCQNGKVCMSRQHTNYILSRTV